jgi:uncharacterized protein (TIGR00255 family)
MIKSMTGFGRGRYEGESLACSVEIKSVNHRFLDIHIRLPGELSNLEIQIRKLIQARARRGRIDVSLNVERNDAGNFTVNAALLQAYLNALEQLKRNFGLSGEVDLVQLLRTPGIVNLDSLKLTGEALKRAADGISGAVSNALDELDLMKIEEGKALRADILKRLEVVAGNVNKIKNLSQDRTVAYQRRLQSRLSEMLEGIAIDPVRVLQEAAFYAERSDISEEITRLQSHYDQCKALLDSAEDVGKTIDFILQEMNREANTTLSKTTGIAGNGLDISTSGVLIKTEIEKIREQIQNVE